MKKAASSLDLSQGCCPTAILRRLTAPAAVGMPQQGRSSFTGLLSAQEPQRMHARNGNPRPGWHTINV